MKLHSWSNCFKCARWVNVMPVQTLRTAVKWMQCAQPLFYLLTLNLPMFSVNHTFSNASVWMQVYRSGVHQLLKAALACNKRTMRLSLGLFSNLRNVKSTGFALKSKMQVWDTVSVQENKPLPLAALSTGLWTVWEVGQRRNDAAATESKQPQGAARRWQLNSGSLAHPWCFRLFSCIMWNSAICCQCWRIKPCQEQVKDERYNTTLVPISRLKTISINLRRKIALAQHCCDSLCGSKNTAGFKVQGICGNLTLFFLIAWCSPVDRAFTLEMLARGESWFLVSLRCRGGVWSTWQWSRAVYTWEIKRPRAVFSQLIKISTLDISTGWLEHLRTIT